MRTAFTSGSALPPRIRASSSNWAEARAGSASDPPALPHHPADDRHLLRSNFNRRIGEVLAEQREHALPRRGDALDHQGLALPHHPADDRHLLRSNFNRRIGEVLAEQREHALPRRGDALDHQGLAQPDHMHTVTKRPRRAIDQDLVAVAQQWLHRIALDGDRGKSRPVEPVLAKPALRKAQGVKGQLIELHGSGPRRGANIEPRHRDPFGLRERANWERIIGFFLCRYQLPLVHTEKPGELAAILLLQFARAALADKLL